MIEFLWRIQKISITCIILILVCINNADACSRILSEETNESTEIEKAKYVFRGLVTKVEIASNELSVGPIMLTKVYYNPIEALKGSVPKDGYILSQTGYFGGCAVPVLVGLEYLFALNKEDAIFNFDGHPKLNSLFEESIGMISIFNTTQLPVYKPKLDEAMSEVREWATKQH